MLFAVCVCLCLFVLFVCCFVVCGVGGVCGGLCCVLCVCVIALQLLIGIANASIAAVSVLLTECNRMGTR